MNTCNCGLTDCETCACPDCGETWECDCYDECEARRTEQADYE